MLRKLITLLFFLVAGTALAQLNPAFNSVRFQGTDSTSFTLGNGTLRFNQATNRLRVYYGGSWKTVITHDIDKGFNNPMTTEGDIILGGASGAPGRLGIGTNGYVLTSNGTTASWQPAAGGGSSVFSDLTAALATNDIDNAAYQQDWRWNSLAGGSGLKLSSNSTAATGNTQKLFEVNLSGANATSTQKTFAGYFNNAHSGTDKYNVGVRGDASGTGGTNIGVFGAASGGGGASNYSIYGSGTGYFTNVNAGIGVNIVGTSGTSEFQALKIDFINASSSGVLQFTNTGSNNTGSVKFRGSGYASIPSYLDINTQQGGILLNPATGVVIGPASTAVTANTRLDVRGTGTGTNKGFRFADSGNTERFTILDNGTVNLVTAPANDDALTQVLVRDGSTGAIKYRTAASLGGGGIGGSTGSIDNVVLRSDGTGGSTLQASDISINDGGNINLGLPATTGTSRVLQAAGTDSNIAISIQPKGTGSLIVRSTTESLVHNNSGFSLFTGSPSYGSGTGVVNIANATTPPTTDPTSSFLLYSSSTQPEGSAPLFRTSGGHVGRPIYQVSGSTSGSAFYGCGTAPLTVIAAPGAGKYINIVSVTVSYDYTTTAYDFAASEHPTFKFSGTSGTKFFVLNSTINGTADFNRILQMDNSSSDWGMDAPTNTAFVLTTADGGNGTQGTGTFKYKIYYTIENI